MSSLLKILSLLLMKSELKTVNFIWLVWMLILLFTNTPLDETIDICIKKLFKTPDTFVKGISKNDFRDLLNLATNESFFTFNNKFYIQLDGVAFGSPLGPILANIFLSHLEEKWLNKCPTEFKFFRRYVDDMFVLFELPESAHWFRRYMSSKHENINFTVEQENVGSFSFLDVKIYIVKTVNFSLVFTENQHLVGFSPIMKVSFQRAKKRGLLHTLLLRSFCICCDFKAFHFEIDHLKTILIKNNYPSNFINSCIKSSLNKLYTPKVMVPKLWLGSTLFQILKKLQKLFSDKLTSCNLKIAFTSPVRVKSFFTVLPKMLLSGLVYKYKCGGCNATYYGKTKHHFKVRICEHLGISHLTGKKGKDRRQQANGDPRAPLMLQLLSIL